MSEWHPKLSHWELQRPKEVSPIGHERAWSEMSKAREEHRARPILLRQYAGWLEEALGLPDVYSMM